MSRFPLVDAILAVEVGNSRIGMAVADDDGLRGTTRVPNDRPEAWEPALRGLLAQIEPAARRAVVVASVVPERTQALLDLLEQLCEAAPLRVREDLPLPLPVALDSSDEVGIDRVCAAAAAYDQIQGACAIASFGTAITIDCVSDAGEFLGGVILPGLDMSCQALHERTALLPRVQPGLPLSPLGKNTRDAIIGGVAYGAVGALREVVERIATQLGQWPHLVITGGNAALVRDLANFVDSVVPDLCLMGIALAYRKASGSV